MPRYEGQRFIEPLNARSREVISHNLGIYFGESFNLAGGKSHELFKCDAGLIFMLWRNRVDQKIRFRIWRQQKNGVIRDITISYRQDRGSGKKSKKPRYRRNRNAKF